MSIAKELSTSTFSLLLGYIFKLLYEKFKNNAYSSTLLLDKFKPLLVSVFFILMVISFVITVLSVLNIIRKTIVRFRHSNNLLSKPNNSLVFIEPSFSNALIKDMPIDNVIVFGFEVSAYSNNLYENVMYTKVDKIICIHCSSEILNNVKQTFWGNFLYTCVVCNRKTKLKYDRYTLIKKVELMMNASLREIYYTNKDIH